MITCPPPPVWGVRFTLTHAMQEDTHPIELGGGAGRLALGVQEAPILEAGEGLEHDDACRKETGRPRHRVVGNQCDWESHTGLVKEGRCRKEGTMGVERDRWLLVPHQETFSDTNQEQRGAPATFPSSGPMAERAPMIPT
jgi:hypothetical protein